MSIIISTLLALVRWIPWEKLVDALFQFGLKNFTTWISLDELTVPMKYIVATVYFTAGGLGEYLVERSDTKIDDIGLKYLMDICKDLSSTFSFPLVDAPELSS